MLNPKNGADGAVNSKSPEQSAPKAEISEALEQARGEVVGDSTPSDPGKGREKMSVSWSAPLPPPSAFNKYPESIQDRMMTLVEDESKDRRTAYRELVQARIKHNKGAQNFSFVVLLVVIFVSAVLVWHGKPYGLLLALVGLAPVLNSIWDSLRKVFHSSRSRDEHPH